MTRKHFTNKNIAKILREMGMYYEIKNIPFKPQAYEKAAMGIESLDQELEDLYKKTGESVFDKIPGVGKGIHEHLKNLFKKGTFTEYKKVKKEIPKGLMEMTEIEGVGAKVAYVLWKKLKIKNIKDLESAARVGKISKLPHFGKKSEEKILRGIDFLKKSRGRQILGFLLPEIRSMEKEISSFPSVTRAMVAGSARRRKETIGDIDFLVSAKNSKATMEKFISMKEVSGIHVLGDTKASVKLRNGLDADIRIVPEKSFGSALNYFTGSKEHNIILRELAIKKGGCKLNEYGLFDKKGKKIAGKTEEDIYKILGLNYIEPELRENTGEIEVSRNGVLPNLIPYDSLLGDLQVQTDWTDGEDSIEKMARAAANFGLEYIAITDHTKSLAMTGGSDEKKLGKQIKEIKKINDKLKKENIKIKILTGAEVNISEDGKLDIADSVLAELDIVGVAVHSYFKLSSLKQTRRVIRAMENINADIVFHLTSRLINKREAIHLDIDEVIKTAKNTKTVLEIDSYPNRLDIKDEYIKKSVQSGVKMSIDSDAHSVLHYRYLEMGIATARRGWAEKKDIINAWPLDTMLAMLKK